MNCGIDNVYIYIKKKRLNEETVAQFYHLTQQKKMRTFSHNNWQGRGKDRKEGGWKWKYFVCSRCIMGG